MQPWLSVLMPVYNGRAYLAAALESVAAQADGGVEIIAVDDGSTDDSLDILRAFEKRLPLRVLHGSHTGSWVRNTNTALALARGEFVGLLHQDDLWLPGRLQALRELTTRHPEAGVFFHPAWFVAPDGRRIGLWNTSLEPGEYAAGALWERLLIQNFIAIPAPIVRRSTAESVGGLDDRLWYTADWDFWLRLTHAVPAVYHAEPLAAFRIHAESQTMRRSACSDEFRSQLLAAYEPHERRWLEFHPRQRGIHQAARFSIEMNVALAQMAHGRRPHLVKLAMAFLKLGPPGWRRYLRDSRIIDRVGARLRLNLVGRRAVQPA
jgi:glycosyltransferase involved in cell wall biosynthesis